MLVKNMILAILFLQLVACGNSNRKNTIRHDNPYNNKASNLKKENNKYGTIKPIQKEPFFNKNTSIQILSFSKEYDPNSSTDDSTTSTMKDYNNWILNKKDILNILKSGIPISGTEWDFNYEVLPFWYKGEFLINDNREKYKINAASFVILTFKDSTVYLGCPQKSSQKYFLAPPNLE